MAKTYAFSKAETEAKLQETLREVKQTTQAISAGEGGKLYDTLAIARAVTPKPVDRTVFTVSELTDPNNAGYHVFDSTKQNGTKFQRPFDKIKPTDYYYYLRYPYNFSKVGTDLKIEFLGGESLRVLYRLKHKGDFISGTTGEGDKYILPAGEITLASNQALILNLESREILVQDFPSYTRTDNDVILLLNVDGDISTGVLKDWFKDPEPKQKDAYYYLRYDFDFSVSGTDLNIQFLGGDSIRIMYRLKSEGSFTSSTSNIGDKFILPSSAITLSSNDALILNLKTRAITVNNFTTFQRTKDHVILLLNIDGKVVTGVLKDWFIGSTSIPPVSNDVEVVPVSGERISFDLINTWQSFTFVGDELWVGRPSNDEQTDTGTFQRFNFSTLQHAGSFTHNFGHVNTIDYNSENDHLIMGNGSGDYDLPLKIFIFPNVSSWIGQSNIDFATVDKIVIDLDFDESKANAVWGESNLGKNNIIYLITNDNKVIRKCLLGLGSNQFEHGVFASGVGANEYNGTMKVLSRHEQEYDSDVNQDGTFYNGSIYVATGHNGIQYHKFSLLDNGGIKATKYQHTHLLNDDGTRIPQIYAEGLAVKNGVLYTGYTGGGAGIMKITI